MSDKFFFKGRQDARQTTLKYGYQPDKQRKVGSKKYPLQLTVTSEARKHEIEKVVAEANLFANVILDHSPNAKESIDELNALLNKGVTISVDKVPSRNALCLCGSGKKYKKCCG